MPFNIIIMSYKQNCTAEGEIITRLKIAKLYFCNKKNQKKLLKIFNVITIQSIILSKNVRLN